MEVVSLKVGQTADNGLETGTWREPRQGGDGNTVHHFHYCLSGDLLTVAPTRPEILMGCPDHGQETQETGICREHCPSSPLCLSVAWPRPAQPLKMPPHLCIQRILPVTLTTPTCHHPPLTRPANITQCRISGIFFQATWSLLSTLLNSHCKILCHPFFYSVNWVEFSAGIKWLGKEYQRSDIVGRRQQHHS